MQGGRLEGRQEARQACMQGGRQAGSKAGMGLPQQQVGLWVGRLLVSNGPPGWQNLFQLSLQIVSSWAGRGGHGKVKSVIFGKPFCFIGHLAEIVELQSVANRKKLPGMSTSTRMQHPGMMYVRVRVPVFARVPY